jgi:hypothetical protein
MSSQDNYSYRDFNDEYFDEEVPQNRENQE